MRVYLLLELSIEVPVKYWTDYIEQTTSASATYNILATHCLYNTAMSDKVRPSKRRKYGVLPFVPLNFISIGKFQ